jgi:hypothetical protein
MVTAAMGRGRGDSSRTIMEIWKLSNQIKSNIYFSYSSAIYNDVCSIIKRYITSPTAQAYRIHAHSSIYNIYDRQVPQQHAGQVMAWFQEVKRDLIYRRFKRCTGRATQPDWTRLLGYLINTLGRMVSLYNYQGQNAEGLKSCRDYLTQLIQ